ncbi:hypothetical protein O6P43_018482 [Quillaja saponaria]|uniref:Uncharacterized protein n=1 Tax=Quillaja saponaria TaxID=32244 RepID=A0AAD7LUJ8_QUISA|nr:hypothetical protein O6P43_018482 [Quillaja saponaria]
MMSSIKHVLVTGRRCWFNASTASEDWVLIMKLKGTLRLMATKPSSRAAVHGVKLPLPDIVDKEEVQKEILKRKEEKEAKRKEIEKKLDSQLKYSIKPADD